ncbi:hypothetical protein HP1_024 [Candidatus Termititenax spirochaetophilus]|uniref:Rod shape-determining protein MreD n=1 Tax=Candidatus Termititenax spirochaetophilus TaxID=2218522 RepID=A0A388T6Y2_9BACT|nr:hypothetical protein HP1_024 [Candidatus Termititenax spirochaetophilus]
MIYISYSVVFLLTYILQTTVLSGWPLRPELILIVFCLMFSGRSSAGLIAGFLTGAFLDILSGYSFYNMILYSITGLLCGFMPVSIFRDFRSLAFVNMLIGSVILNTGYAVLSRIFLGKAILLSPLSYFLVLVLNIVFFWIIYFIFVRRKYNIYD